MAAVTYFAPQPHPSELPDRFASPFAQSPPHALARRAIDLLRTQVHRTELGLDAPGGGKMFGVLVVADGDRIGYLCAFSGMLRGSWALRGFVPAVFDAVARDAVWPAGEAELARIDRRIHELEREAAPLRVELAELDAGHELATRRLRELHDDNRRARHEARLVPLEGAARHALDQASRRDTAERKRLVALGHEARAALAARLRNVDDERLALEQHRTDRSRVLLRQIHDSYVLASARGERRALRDLFAPEAPPGGAGDCAAPKLLAHAYAHGLRPLALAEVWWGAPPATGGRHDGAFYPACRGKCGPILAHMLDGLAAEPPPVFGARAIAVDQPRVVFEDRWLVVVDKPCGLLSVPGRSGALRDSVVVRLKQRYPDATGPLLVHRLDLDTSGLLLAAKDRETHAALQAMFARREIEKRYVAWLEAPVDGDHGVIELALRVDVDDRPRQIHDPVHGKAAITEWRVLERTASRTRVALVPRTGRTHQLRVHAAHALGLGAPIAGDPLYARASAPEERMLLHAEAIGFVHPRTGERLELELPAPF
ncbi:MAG: Pseudouridine synthase [Deltaproteobacteria bacterium]|nr:Pseudouridine synthase [Deltaproteobacteria bacterium]